MYANLIFLYTLIVLNLELIHWNKLYNGKYTLTDVRLMLDEGFHLINKVARYVKYVGKLHYHKISLK